MYITLGVFQIHIPTNFYIFGSIICFLIQFSQPLHLHLLLSTHKKLSKKHSFKNAL